VLDPACGSGNFLYLALKCLKDIEHQVNLEGRGLGLERQHDVTGPHNVLGIELNEYAAELARVTVWIGELQWRIQRGYAFKTNPVLDRWTTSSAAMRCWGRTGRRRCGRWRMRWWGTRRSWATRRCAANSATPTPSGCAGLQGRVPGGADLVCYWFEKARAQIEAARLQRAGLVATNSIRGGANREVLDRICDQHAHLRGLER
jgi:hypothetical protein